MNNALKGISRTLLKHLPPSVVIKVEFLRRHGTLPNLRNPRTFNEKIQFRKLHGDHTVFASFADKIIVKDYVRRVLGETFVIPTLWAGTRLPSVDERNWPLPFVIKANRGSGWNLFVRTEDEKRWDEIEHTCERWLRTTWPGRLVEPWYNKIPPMILIEPLIDENPKDYKFYVFHGQVQFVQVDTDRFTSHRRCFYDRDWKRCPFSLEYPIETRELERPLHLSQMVEAAEKLSNGFDFVRVDLYELEYGPKFGEMTCAPEAGYGKFSPVEYDLVLGEMWLD